jgi:hypothetical protein
LLVVAVVVDLPQVTVDQVVVVQVVLFITQADH